MELVLTMTAGGKPIWWKTMAYWIPLVDMKGKVHKVLAYAMEHIMMRLNYVEVRGVARLFKGIKPPDILRPSGEVDLLMGMEDAELHPRVLQCVSNLRLMSSIFGTRHLLDGTHGSLNGDPAHTNKED